MEGSPIKLIEGGKQKRCFTDISDGIEALFRIIENKDGRCNGEIINIGNPDNEASIRELAEMLLASFERHRCAASSRRLPVSAKWRAAATTARVIRTLSTASRASAMRSAA